MATRAIEVYLGVGTDFGTWGTEYVDIPADTPEDKIEQAARDAARAEGYEFVFCGVYCIPPMDDQPYEPEKSKEEKITRIKEILKEWSPEGVSTMELEAQTSPCISQTGQTYQLVERFALDCVSVFTYVGSVETSEDELSYEELAEEVIDEILDLLEDYDTDCYKTMKRCED